MQSVQLRHNNLKCGSKIYLKIKKLKNQNLSNFMLYSLWITSCCILYNFKSTYTFFKHIIRLNPKIKKHIMFLYNFNHWQLKQGYYRYD